MKAKASEVCFRGTPVSRGVAIGKPCFLTFVEGEYPDCDLKEEEVEKEIERYRGAVQSSDQEVRRLKQQLETEGAVEGAAVLEAHLQMIRDPLLTSAVEEEIARTLKNAESVFRANIQRVEQKFLDIRDPFFRERAKDIQDVSRRVMSHLIEKGSSQVVHLPDRAVVFSRELAPSDTAEATFPRIRAFVTEVGGAMSHAAIVAKAKGIPYVTGIDFARLESSVGQQDVIVDGRTGEVIVNPKPRTLEKYRLLQEELETHALSLPDDGRFCTETYDGVTLRLCANVEMANEIDMLHQYGGEGVGLFRSEFIFLANHSFPSEDDQFALYRRAVEQMKGLPIVMRTFDIGGDKFPELRLSVQDGKHSLINSRSCGLLLKEKTIFKTQVRALLRASAFGAVSILFPMISGVNEFLEAKEIVLEAWSELKSEGKLIADVPRLGCMIEVPSAAVTADLLAEECDFLSIGTNDLVQYTLAVDRESEAASGWQAATQPSLLRLIKWVTIQGKACGTPISLCGEIASDPRFTALLIGLGVEEFSVAPRYLPLVKHCIRSTSYVDAVRLADKALTLRLGKEIQQLLLEEFQRRSPKDAWVYS